MSSIQVRCPGCGSRYQISGSLQVLQTQPFICKKCGFRVPFSSLYNLQNGGKVVNTPPPPPPPSVNPHSTNKTRVVSGNGGMPPVAPGPGAADPKKTRVVPGAGGRPAGGPQGPMKTRVPGAFLVVKSLMRELRLHNGTFVLGRDSSDSTADLKLAPDPYMSRQHAVMKVDTSGGKERYYIKSIKNENPVYVNRRPLPTSQMAALKHGDVLVLGQTVVEFVKK